MECSMTGCGKFSNHHKKFGLGLDRQGGSQGIYVDTETDDGENLAPLLLLPLVRDAKMIPQKEESTLR